MRVSGFLLIIMFFPALIAAPRAEAGQTIIAVQGVRAKPYTRALKGFKTALSPDAHIHQIILSDSADKNPEDRITEAAPDLVLALGMEALKQVNGLADIPVVYVMVLDAAAEFSRKRNVTGVSMVVDPKRQLEIIGKALPGVRTVGLLYDPEQSGEMVDRIRAAADRHPEISLAAKEVYRAENVPASVILMKEEIDAFWMLPDITVVTPETVRFFLTLTMESGRPVISFSEKYARQGALISIGADPFDMGGQAARIAGKILAGTAPAGIPAQYAEKAVITVNARIAEKIGIQINEEILEQARVIE